MKKPKRSEFIEEMKFDGKVYKSVNEELFRHAMRRWEDYKRTLERHHN